MATMKNIVLPILEELSTGDGTRMQLHDRCKNIIASWTQFKRIFSMLLADGLIARKDVSWPDQFEITEEGREIVQSSVG